MNRIQEGIAYEPRTRPPACWRLLLLDAAPETDARDLSRALADLVSMLRDLGAGRIRELAGQPAAGEDASREQFEGLRTLVGYGRRLFDRDVHEPALTRPQRPDFLAYLPKDTSAFPAIPWADTGAPNTGEADIALQLGGDREATVNCAAVECWKLIEDKSLPLTVVDTFSGFGRADGRGWLEFHDGVSNMPSSQRLGALAAGPHPGWMRGGTYMAFLRLAVDLRAWRRLDRSDQELMVGRDKLSGAAVVGVTRDAGGRALPVAATAPGVGASAEERAAWRDPPETTDPVVEASHIHRANQNRASPGAPGGLRIFRQGYDFLDGFRDGRPVLGLNFVSFQRDLRTLQHLLHLPGWLGDVNFGGTGDPAAPALVELLAGGFYAVPQRAEPFPGSKLFT